MATHLFEDVVKHFGHAVPLSQKKKFCAVIHS